MDRQRDDVQVIPICQPADSGGTVSVVIVLLQKPFDTFKPKNIHILNTNMAA